MIVDAFNEAVNSVMERRLRDAAQRDLVVEAVMTGFAALQKKPVPDLEKRTQDMTERVRRMAESISLGFVGGRLVVTVRGSSESLMSELRFGTNWFAPWEKVDEILLAAILVEPRK